ncbi:hypothetical protein ACFE04_031872 [Oxalis oulophora]
MLSTLPEFVTFNTYLTQTDLAKQINSRRTITVLAVENGAISQIQGKPLETIQKILSVHVILDYYDDSKMLQLPENGTTLTTLFQASGLAMGQQGFMNISKLSSGTVVFGSSVPKSNANANFIKDIVHEIYNISILQVSNLIIPPGLMGSSAAALPPPPPPPPKSAPTPSPTSPPSSPAHSPDYSTPSHSPTSSSTPADSPGKFLSLVLPPILSPDNSDPAVSLTPTHSPTEHSPSSSSTPPTHSPEKSPAHPPEHSSKQSPDQSPTHPSERPPTHSPEQSPAHTPEHSSVSTPEHSPSHSPEQSSTHSPDHAPDHSPEHSPEQSPSHSPEQSPAHSSEQSPGNSPSSSPTTAPMYDNAPASSTHGPSDAHSPSHVGEPPSEHHEHHHHTHTTPGSAPTEGSDAPVVDAPNASSSSTKFGSYKLSFAMFVLLASLLALSI